MSQRLFAIRANQKFVLSIYLYYELSKGHGFSQILGSLSGSTVFGIRQDVLRTIKIVIPDLSLQQRFDETVLPQLKQIKNLEEENRQLAKLREWLIPMLMNGQISVK
ncbi:restriction endonuclease subunit S [Legionella steelei]|uniref:restriction endonuclease subunit S n=1 Tax=Legionella steelei TaxID=947033 RepID=UPI00138ED525|nr:restriction endonuclease subunit S [Legionella steelei]